MTHSAKIVGKRARKIYGVITEANMLRSYVSVVSDLEELEEKEVAYLMDIDHSPFKSGEWIYNPDDETYYYISQVTKNLDGDYIYHIQLSERETYLEIIEDEETEKSKIESESKELAHENQQLQNRLDRQLNTNRYSQPKRKWWKLWLSY